MCEHCQKPVEAADNRASMLVGARNYQGPFRKTPGRLVGMTFIRLYQFTFSAFVGNSCRHMPTCSEYGFEAIARHGFWAGGWMTLSRVVTCGPGGTSGFDPVREQLSAGQMWWTPWRYLRRK
jgi:putative membrane protein insertion efficiency factor